MFLYHPSSFSASLTFTLFSQDSLRQSPHVGTHCNPLLKHKHNLVLQGFFEDSLDLQHINCRRFSGAVSKSVLRGSKPSSVVFRPHSNGFKQLTFISFHCATCKLTRKAWKKIALSVGGRFTCFKNKDVGTASINLTHLNDLRLPSDFPQ